MRIIRPKKHHESEDYWQPATDIMVGLLLVIILVLSLLLSYLARKDDKYEYETTQTTIYTTDDDRDDTSHTTEWTRRTEQDGGGGGGEKETTTTTVPSAGGGGNPSEDQGKTAVLISVIDEETGNIIKQKGIKFELYADRDAQGGLQALHTYYPTKIEYKEYETDDNGRFYLPEKIVKGWYSLHNLTVPEEYEAGSNKNFRIKKPQDWDDPFLVSVPLSPAKNIIKLNAIDSETRDPVADGVYEIIADEDIVLLDGSVRLKAGQSAGILRCDENGYAESKRLYLGKYRIRQKKAREYYAINDAVINTEVKNSADSEVPICEALCEKTAYTLTLTDEYTKEPIADAVFLRENGKQEKTDENGSILLTDLSKGTEYSLTLDELPAPYRTSEKLSTSFKVNKKGQIKGDAKYDFEATAYAIRFSATVEDRLLRNDVDGVNLTLYDSDGKPVSSWDVGGTDHIIEDLEPGTYQLEIAGRSSTRKTFEVKDVGGLQTQSLYIWTALDFVLIFAGVALLVGFVLLLVYLIRRKKKVKTDG